MSRAHGHDPCRRGSFRKLGVPCGFSLPFTHSLALLVDSQRMNSLARNMATTLPDRSSPDRFSLTEKTIRRRAQAARRVA